MARLVKVIKVPKTPPHEPSVAQPIKVIGPEAVRGRRFKLPKLRMPFFKKDRRRFESREDIIEGTLFMFYPLPGLFATLIIGILTLFIDSKDELDPANIEKNKKTLQEQDRAKQLKKLIKLIKNSNKDSEEISVEISNAVLFLNRPGIEEGSPTYKAIGLLQDILTDAFSDKNLSVDVIFEKVVDGVCKTFKEDPKSFTSLSHSNLNVAVDFVSGRFKPFMSGESQAEMASKVPTSTEKILQTLTQGSNTGSITREIEELRSRTTNLRIDYQLHKGGGLYGQDNFDFLLTGHHPFYTHFMYNKNFAQRKPLEIEFLNLDSQNENNNKI
jgi:hypothetical protein